MLREPFSTKEIDKIKVKLKCILILALSTFMIIEYLLIQKFLLAVSLNNEYSGIWIFVSFFFGVLALVFEVLAVKTVVREYPQELSNEQKESIVEYLNSQDQDRQTQNEVAYYLAKVKILERSLLNIDKALLKRWILDLSERELERKYHASINHAYENIQLDKEIKGEDTESSNGIEF